MTVDVVPALAINTGWAQLLHDGGLRVFLHQPLGPMGLQLGIRRVGSNERGSIVVTQSDHPPDHDEWLHASIAWSDHMPTYADLQLLHRAFFGRRRYAYQVFAPAAKHISGVGMGAAGHEFALHLWSRVDGTNCLPDFGRAGTV